MAYPQNTDDDPVQGDQLKSIVKRIERLDEEELSIKDDKKEVYAEAKALGYDVKILRRCIQLRKRDLNERKEEEAILDLYMQAIGDDKDAPAQQQEQRFPVGAAPTKAERDVAKRLKNLSEENGATVSVVIPPGAGPVLQRAAAALRAEGVDVLEKPKPIVGSFTPPAEPPPEDPYGF